MLNATAEITLTKAGIVGITLHVPSGLHGLREMLDGIQRSVWAVEALDAAIRHNSRRATEQEKHKRHEP
ncbi:MAG: hypothetical protein JSR29_01540 [Nitrospira sp.]|nr:hypothetical protein [Nitrospira sp.]